MTRKVLRRAVALVALLAAVSVGRQGRLWEAWFRVVPRAFAVVEPGRIYRGAMQSPFPMRTLVRACGIKTILSLRQSPCPGERELAAQRQIAYFVVPIERASLATDEQLDQASAILADSSHYPLYFHCRGGKDRSNIVLAAYRIRYCGWCLGDVVGELKRYGFDPLREPQHDKVIRRYYQHVQASEPPPLAGPPLAAELSAARS